MKKMVAAASPDAYVAALRGWRRSCVELLREAARSARGLDEVIKWGNVVYLTNGPVFMIRAEDDRVLFGFWRGARLRALEPGLKPGGKYEMATLEIREATVVDARAMKRLVRAAVVLNREMGNPTGGAPPRKATAASKAQRATKAK